MLPGDLPRLDLGAGLPGEALADVLAVAAAAAGDPASPPDPVPDRAILERVARALGGQPGIGQVTAALRVLAQVGDPREDTQRGLISAVQAEAVAGLYGPAASERVITGRALGLEARLRTLETLGTAPARLPPSRLRVVALGRAADVAGSQVLSAYVTAALTHLSGGSPAAPPGSTRCWSPGARSSAGTCWTGWRTPVRPAAPGWSWPTARSRTMSASGWAGATPRWRSCGSATPATRKAASEQIGTAHRFVVSQLTDTVGDSVSDTASYSYTSTVGTADSVAASASASQSTGRGRGRGQSWSGAAAFAPRTASGHQERNWSEGISESWSWTGGHNSSTAWGVQTARAAAASTSVARTSQRSREFLVEPHELQQLPPSGMIVSYASAAGRRVVFADANPGILALPTATLAGLDEAVARRPGAAQPARADAVPPNAAAPPGPGPPPNLGPPAEPLDWRRAGRPRG